MMQISERGLALVESFEGGQSPDGLFRAYWDAYGRVWTIGYGETHGVHQGMVWTKEQAEADLRTRMDREYLPSIRGLDVPLNPNQVDALCSFVWNLGPGAMQWDVGRYLRAREYRAAADALLAYDRAGGQILAGLVGRRQAERRLFLTRYVEPDPHHYGWMDDTVRDFSYGHHGSERKIAQEYDRRRQHPRLHPRRIRRLRDDLSLLAARLETVMDDDPAGNARNRRGWRHAGLAGRAQGRRYV